MIKFLRRAAQTALLALTLVSSQAFAAWAWQSTGTVAYDADARSGSGGISVGVPSGIVAGNILMMGVISDPYTVAQTWTTPSGWTLIGTQNTESNTSTGALYCKVAAGGETAQQVNASASGNTMGVMLRYTGGTCNVHATAQEGEATVVADVLLPAITITENSVLVFKMVALSQDNTFSGITSWPNTTTTRVATDGTGIALVVGETIQTTAANISAGTLDITAAVSARNGVLFAAMSIPVVAPTFTVTPTVTSQTAAAYTIGGTTDLNSTVKAVACIKDTTAPTATQIKAAHCTGDVAALASQTDTWNGADSLVLGTAITLPIADLYIIATTAGGDSSIVTLADEILDPPTGYSNYLALGTIGTETANLVKVFNDAETPDLVTGDYETCVDGTDPDDYTVVLTNDGNVSYDGPATAQLIKCRFYDVSAAGWHASASPSVEAAFYINWLAPDVGTGTLTLGPYNTGDAITAVALSSVATDPQGSTLTYALTSGTWPAGMAMNSSGSITGTPSVESESGVDVVVTVTNAAGSTATISIRTYIFTTATMVNCVGSTVTACGLLLDAQHANVTLSSVTTTPSATVPEGQVISQNPAAAVEVEHSTTVAIVVSSGNPDALGPVPVQFYPIELAEKLPWLRRYTGLRAAALTEAITNGVWARKNSLNRLRINPLAVPGYPKPAPALYP